MSKINLPAVLLILSSSSAFAQTSLESVIDRAPTIPGGATSFDKVPILRNHKLYTTVSGNATQLSDIAALLAASTLSYPNGVWRSFDTVDSDPIFYKPSTSSCTLNSGNGDNVSQIKSADNKCWLATFPYHKPNIRQFGATGDGSTDDAPAFRAACAWALSAPGKSNAIYVPSGNYLFNSLEEDGGAAVYLNTGTADGKACSLEGPRSAFDYASAPGPLDGPAVLKLGAGKNRPILIHRERGASSHISNLTLDGNKGEQTGWSGGPKNRLFTVQEDDSSLPNFYPETGIIFDDVVLQNGYNGNLYVGAYRYTWGTRLWSQYSGQTTSDNSVWLAGYDSTFWLPAIGNNTGNGMLIESGSQYQIVAGAMWQNGASGLVVSGLQVAYANIWGTNFHANVNGITNTNDAPFPGTSVASVTCTSCTFDQNTNSDVKVDSGAQTNRQMKLISPSFIGNSTGGANPLYNVISAGGIVEISTPTLGTAGSFATAFASVPANVFCNGSGCPTTAFLPTLGDGTPTYVSQIGFAQRAGALVHVQFTVSVSNLGGPSGNMSVGNFPWFAKTGLTGYSAGCVISSVSGWTAPANYDWLTGSITTDENQVILRKNSKSGQASAGALVGEFAAATTITGSCDYIGSF